MTCTAPAATYRCVIADARAGAAQPLQAACLMALAKEGPHAQCEIKRGVTVFECDAPVKRVSAGDNPAVVSAPPPAQPDPNAPPATVLEAMKRAQASSAKSMQAQNEKMEAAASATSTFFKKSLACVGSLFTKCD